MRILHVTTRFRRGGGAERNLTATVHWEIDHGHEVHVAVGRECTDSELPSGAIIHRVPELVRPVSLANDLRAYRHLRAIIRTSGFDIVHTHESKAGIVGRVAALGLADVVIHTIHMASFGPAYNPIASWLFVRAERFCARFTFRLVAVGKELAQLYQQAGIGRPEQYVVVPSPIDVERFQRVRDTTDQEREDSRRAIGMDPDRPVALVIAALEPRKRVHLVLHALAPALSAGRLQLAVAGDGRERGRLVSLVNRLGIAESVRFVGHVEDVPGLMRSGSVLVHAAMVEGVPQVVIQALAAGLPVVATDMLGLREVEGTPVHIAASSGVGLGELVERVIQQRNEPISMASLAPWTDVAVGRGRSALHAQLTGARVR